MGYRHTATNWIRRNIRKIAQFCIFVLAAAMILLDATGVVALTWQAISLFALLTIVAVLNDLEKIDFGEFGGVRFEDEIDTAQQTVDQLEASAGGPARSNAESDAGTGRTDANASGPANREREATPDERDSAPMEMDAAVAHIDSAGESDAERSDRIRDFASRLSALLETNPRCALLQLRLELEHAAATSTANTTTAAAPAGTVGTDAEPQQLAVPDEDVLAAYAEVRSLCNSAIHSRPAPDPDEAARIVDLGLRVLERLDNPVGSG